MNKQISLAQVYFWSLCVVAFGWVAVTVYLESSWGWPNTREAWGHRLIGWFIGYVLLRKFYTGVRSYYGKK